MNGYTNYPEKEIEYEIFCQIMLYDQWKQEL